MNNSSDNCEACFSISKIGIITPALKEQHMLHLCCARISLLIPSSAALLSHISVL